MVALNKDRNTPQRLGKRYGIGVKAATIIYGGSILCRDANGYAVPGATATTLVALGRATARFDNSTGANDAVTAEYEPGEFKFGNSAAGDLIDRTQVGLDCYMVDDQTVAKTSGGGTRSIAGKVTRVGADGGVWVSIGIPHP